MFVILVRRYLNGEETSPEGLVIAAQNSAAFDEEVKRARQRIIKDKSRFMHGISSRGESAYKINEK